MHTENSLIWITGKCLLAGIATGILFSAVLIGLILLISTSGNGEVTEPVINYNDVSPLQLTTQR